MKKHIFQAHSGRTNQDITMVRGLAYSSFFSPEDLHKLSLGKYIYRRVVSRCTDSPLKNKKLMVQYGNQTKTIYTDASGLYTCHFRYEPTITHYSIQYKQQHTVSQAKIYHYNQKNGIISDIDDTIIQSYATSTRKKGWTYISRRPHKRRIFPHTAKAFHKIQKKREADLRYVSHSHTTLYDYITRVFEYNDMPTGPLCLSTHQTRWRKGKRYTNKKEMIEELFSMYPNKQRILIGDTGQEDQDIYTALAKKYRKIQKIILRDVHAHYNTTKQYTIENNTQVYIVQNINEINDL